MKKYLLLFFLPFLLIACSQETKPVVVDQAETHVEIQHAQMETDQKHGETIQKQKHGETIQKQKHGETIQKQKHGETVQKQKHGETHDRASLQEGIDNKAMMALIEKSEREKAKSPQTKRNLLTLKGFPTNVPLDAVWVGEKDRGAYLKIRATGSDPNRFFAEIYLKDGKLYYKGPMELNPKKSERFDFKNPSSYAFFNGRDLILKDGGILAGVRL